HSWGMPPVMFSVITKYHKGRHSLFLYNSEIFYAFTQDILRSHLIKHQPNARIWRADITYLELRPGTWVYLSSIYEPKVHQVLAFKIGRQMEATLVVETINQALECHQKPQYFHSDMGSQYTSNEVETLLERHQISHSYSKQGYPYDNGPIEAFHSLLKREFAFQTT
ncbi:DDE-type integrase/transposase/recombinase, partial [Lactiplantibacillus plantarum]|uniref:DDE-type integrase/transposase/recombinase n=1 Tax=Lactiplantibacillus plantarum TaxID=1590 RepID=UPI003C2028D8